MPSFIITTLVSLAVGLAVSFLIGTTASAISQYVKYGEVNILQVGIDGLFALGSTALAMTGIGTLTSAGIGERVNARACSLFIKHFGYKWLVH